MVELSKEALLECCHSDGWAERMIESTPPASKEALFLKGEEIWFSLSTKDWLEAFQAHPRIGDVNSLKKKFHSTKVMAAGEQSGVNEANEDTLKELARLNQEYFDKFGFIFIVFATGKSASEMLALLKSRIGNSREEELENAAKEQWKITRLRLEKML